MTQLTQTTKELEELQKYVDRKTNWINKRIEESRITLRELCLGEITAEVKKEIDSLVYRISSDQDEIKELEQIIINVSNLRQKINLKDIELGDEFKGTKRKAKAVLTVLFNNLDNCYCEGDIERAKTHSHKLFCNKEFEGSIIKCYCDKMKELVSYPLLAYKDHNKRCYELTQLTEKEGLDEWFWDHQKAHRHIENRCEGKRCAWNFALNFDGNFLYDYMGTYGDLTAYYDPWYGSNTDDTWEFMKPYNLFGENYHSWNRVFYND